MQSGDQYGEALVDYQAKLMNTARAAAAEVHQQGNNCVFIGGAVTAGLGTPNSDIDIFIVKPGQIQTSVRQDERDGQRVDVETISVDQLTSSLEAASPFRATREVMDTIADCTRGNLDRLVRFGLGEVVADDGTLCWLADRFESVKADLDLTIIARHAVDSLNLVEDIVGALAVDDMESALLQSLALYTRAAEATLTRFGDRYIGAKWIWRRWQRTMVPLGSPMLLSAMPSQHTVESLVFASQELLVAAATGDINMISGPAKVRGLPLGLIPIRTADGLTLFPVEGRQGISISDMGIKLWIYAGRFERGDAINSFLSDLGDTAPERAEAEEYYDLLTSLKAV